MSQPRPEKQLPRVYGNRGELYDFRCCKWWWSVLLLGQGDTQVTYAITVEFTLRPGTMVAFRKLIDENAQNSFDLEIGCRRFDVLVPYESQDKILLYEIYEDKTAFEAHVKTEHFLSFNRESNDLVLSKHIVELELAYQAARPRE